MNSTNNNLTITGGQGNYPLAFIETDKALEFTFASSEFTLDMFAMANAVSLMQKDMGTLESRLFEVDDDQKILIPYETQPSSIRINGFELADAVAAGKIKVTVTPQSGSTPPVTEVEFDAGDVASGDTIRVAYRRRVNNAQVATVKTNSTTAKGSLFAHWPVYSSGVDTADSSIKGYLHLAIPRVRVTALPGFDNSYKTAATNAVTFSALNPQRADDKMYDLIYEPLDAQGKIITEPSGGTVDWS